jgi:two-component system chemotaxis response regulator CheY
MDLASKFGRQLNILIVDDHALTRTMVKAILRGIGFENVIQAESGSSAVQIVMEEPVDLVICDWNMPDGNGIEVLRTLRADTRFKKLPFLMLTAEAYRENVTAAMEAGVTDYVIKPFTSNVLIEKVEQTLRRALARGAGAEAR